MVLDEAVDFAHEVGDGEEGATTDGALGDQSEEALDLVEPGSIGRGEVKVPPRPPCEPRPDLGVLVGGVVVDDEMDVEVGRDIGLEVAQEGEEFLVPMAGLALGEDRAIEHVERREKGGGAVPFVVVSDAFNVTEADGEHGLRDDLVDLADFHLAIMRKSNLTALDWARIDVHRSDVCRDRFRWALKVDTCSVAHVRAARRRAPKVIAL